MPPFDIITTGAGPAGLLAAGEAARRGRRVLLLEKMEKPARKLRITGKGRCNITNTGDWSAFEAHIFPAARSFRPAFMHFPNTALIRFMEEEAGVPLIEERGRRIFPRSSRAQDVADALVRWTKRQGVTIRCHAEVTRLLVDRRRATAVEVRLDRRTEIIAARALIVATGGLSYPATGSTGDGYRWAETTGHTITPTRPALVALALVEPPAIAAPLTLRNVALTLLIDGREAGEEGGEMTFTAAAVEGPTILRLSLRAVDALRQEKKVALRLNLKPALSPRQIVRRLEREEREYAPAPLAAALRRWLPAPLVAPFMAQARLTSAKNAAGLAGLTESDRARLVRTFHEWEFPVAGYGGYDRAVVTAGGVSMKDIDPKTMRSRTIENLFWAGETLDLNADTGGYNLQIAFSTGYLAGLSAAAACELPDANVPARAPAD
ncbi:MAG: aminoacetone oxidase family FAD-binding enzyme [Prevotellaceae bacterium]|jgi:predicted Rossmann fold flavoprotein|nr:aminoacetone oxidase family FAD-binding enzyme [Prevotellaceae bacterium]